MGKADAPPGSIRALATLAAHAVYISDSDESELIRRSFEIDDVAMLALRTCLCGVRVDGFDEYWEHLRESIAGTVAPEL